MSCATWIPSLRWRRQLEEVGFYVFYGCVSLKGAIQGESLRIIGTRVFVSCPLVNFDLSSVLKSVKPLVFEGLEFQDAEGNVLYQTAKALRGHSYQGGGVLVERS